jgi:mannose-6-phosphate isomerase-like protein (cupin superfamily)
MYYIVEGSGVFILNDENHEVKTGDLVVVPPNTRIHYFGKMSMVLTVTPTFDEQNEVHVRFIEKTESPLA